LIISLKLPSLNKADGFWLNRHNWFAQIDRKTLSFSTDVPNEYDWTLLYPNSCADFASDRGTYGRPAIVIPLENS
jgi:hypothetical protein